MAASKIIVVTGATGNQGSSVAKHFLALPEWHVRCLTRDPSSAAATNLSAQGAEVVKGNFQDKDSLTEAFKDANAIFLNTDFWATYKPAKAALEAEKKDVVPASLPTLERFIYSALSPINKATNGKYPHSLHSEAKSWIVEYIENEQPDLAKKTSIIYPGVYHVNQMLTPRLDAASGKYLFVLPVNKDTKLPIINARESIGPFVQELIEDEAPGTKLLAYDSYLKVEDIVAEWSKASGKEAMFVPISIQTMHEKFGLPYELLDAPAYVAEFGYVGGIDGIIEPSQLARKVQTKSFEDWLKERNWDEALAA
ncbi:hscarg dehydrogenase protein [Rutstroemia sp. NJR-2017a BBW]|nr:hscarg dehydrogenase protein [Rutstroemia sp. NJR-2017a BBW]